MNKPKFVTVLGQNDSLLYTINNYSSYSKSILLYLSLNNLTIQINLGILTSNSGLINIFTWRNNFLCSVCHLNHLGDIQ